MSNRAVVTPNPLIEPYLNLHLSHREAVKRLVATLSDEEMEQVLVLFNVNNLKDIPYEFWPVAPAVRLAIKAEKKHRTEREAHRTSLIGSTPE